MKSKILKTGLVMLVMLAVFAEASHAVEFEPSFIFGNFKVSGGQKESSGRKFMIGTRFDAIFRKKDIEGLLESDQFVVGLEFLTTGEPLDDAFRMVTDCTRVSGTFSRNFFLGADTRVYPFVGAGFNEVKRNSSPDKRDWGDLWFVDFDFGLGVEHEDWRVKLGGQLPRFTRTDSIQELKGELGFTFDIGFKVHKNIDLGVFYKQINFEGDDKLKMELICARLIYIF